MILANSRYANSSVVTLEAPAVFGGGDVAVIVPSPASTYSFQYVNYQVMQGDRIDTLAYQFYADATQWWRIAQANPETLFWDSLTVGVIIRVPVV